MIRLFQRIRNNRKSYKRKMKSLLKNFKKSRKKIVIISMTYKGTLKNLKSKLLTLKSKTIKTNQNNKKKKKLKSSSLRI